MLKCKHLAHLSKPSNQKSLYGGITQDSLWSCHHIPVFHYLFPDQLTDLLLNLVALLQPVGYVFRLLQTAIDVSPDYFQGGAEDGFSMNTEFRALTVEPCLGLFELTQRLRGFPLQKCCSYLHKSSHIKEVPRLTKPRYLLLGPLPTVDMTSPPWKQ